MEFLTFVFYALWVFIFITKIVNVYSPSALIDKLRKAASDFDKEGEPKSTAAKKNIIKEFGFHVGINTLAIILAIVGFASVSWPFMIVILPFISIRMWSYKFKYAHIILSIQNLIPCILIILMILNKLQFHYHIVISKSSIVLTNF